MDSQWFEVVKIVVDKLLIGGIVAVAAYVGAKGLESHRSRNALALELNKRRAEAMAHAWELLAKFEIATNHLGAMTNFQQQNPNSAPHMEAFAESSTEFREAQVASIVAIRAVSYWFGSEVAGDLTTYHNAISDVGFAIGTGVDVKPLRTRLAEVSNSLDSNKALTRLKNG